MLIPLKQTDLVVSYERNKQPGVVPLFLTPRANKANEGNKINGTMFISLTQRLMEINKRVR